MPRTIAGETSAGVQVPLRVNSSGQIETASTGSTGATISGPLGRAADAASVSAALSTEDVALVGALTETAPASDTASSGLNGRLQRVAQNVSTLFGRFTAAATLADATALPSTTIVGAAGLRYNGSTLDIERGNVDFTILSSAVRTTTTNSADFTNQNARGLLLFLNVTVSGAADTLQIRIQMKDPASGQYQTLLAPTATAYATGQYIMTVYPGATTTLNGVATLPLSRVWRVAVVHSGSNSWTYSIGASLIL